MPAPTVTLPVSGVAPNEYAVKATVEAAINAALATLYNQTALCAPIANPTFTGTVGGITKTMVGLGSVDNTSDADKPISTAAATALGLKAPLASPAFTGTPTGITKTHVGLGNVDNTSDANKPVSAAQQTALNAKLNATFALPEQVVQGLEATLPVNSVGVYAAVRDVERRVSDTLQARLPAALTDGVVSPGMSPERYAVATEGAPGYLAPVVYPLVIGNSARGKVLEWSGSGSLATQNEEAARLTPIGVMSLASGRVWQVRAVYRRATASADPAGDAIRVAVQWLAADFSSAGLTTAETNIVLQTSLTPGAGWQTVTAVIAQAPGTGVDHANAEAVYARVFIEQQGNPSYEDGPLISVLELVQQDITFAEVVTDVAAGIDARVTVLENRDVFSTVTLANGANLRALTQPGDFTVTNPTNGPAGAATTMGGSLRVRDANTAHITVWDLAGVNDGMWWSQKIGGAWGAWSRIASAAYVDGQIQGLANDLDALSSASGTIVPTLAFATPGTSSWVYGNRSGWWARTGKIVTGHVVIQATPTKGTAAGGLYLAPQFLDAGLVSVPLLPIFNGTGAGVCPVDLGSPANYPAPTNAIAAAGEIRHDSTGRVQLGYITLSGGILGRVFFGPSNITDGVQIQLSASFTYVVA